MPEAENLNYALAHHMGAGQTDFLLLPSLFEGQGMVVLEAFASDVVVAGTNVGYLCDFGDERCIVPTGDSEQLVKKISALIENQEMMATIRERNRKIVERFTAKTTAEQYCTLYEDVLKKE